jgi:hypothetical protein
MTPKFPKISLDPVNSTQIARVQRERTGLTNSTTRRWLSRSGLQLFLYVEVSEFVCLPGRSYRYKIPAGLLRRLHRSRTYIVTFARTGYTVCPTTGGARTFALQDSQHDRLLLVIGDKSKPCTGVYIPKVG